LRRRCRWNGSEPPWGRFPTCPAPQALIRADREPTAAHASSNIGPENTLGRYKLGDTNEQIRGYWSEEDQAFVAEAPELPGCAAHGATHEAALASAQDAIRLWIETAKEFGDPIPEPKGRRLIFA
jgi:predicted RNase H-like HicB family nuclease